MKRFLVLFGLVLALNPHYSPVHAQETQIIETQPARTEAEFGKSSVDFTWLFLKTLLAMVVVIALAVVALRFFLPRLSWGRQIKGRMGFKILERLPLDTKKGLYVIEVEGRRLLLGASEHSVNFIAELGRHEGEND